MLAARKNTEPVLLPSARTSRMTLSMRSRNCTDFGLAGFRAEPLRAAQREPWVTLFWMTAPNSWTCDCRAANWLFRYSLWAANASWGYASNAFELSFAAAKDGVVAFNAKALAAVRANTEANLDFVKASLTAKSVSDFVALQSEFARKQTDAVVVQFQELAELAKNTVVETLQPIKDQVTKSFKIAV